MVLLVEVGSFLKFGYFKVPKITIIKKMKKWFLINDKCAGEKK